MYLLYICDSLYHSVYTIHSLKCLLFIAYKYVRTLNKSLVSVLTLSSSLVVNLVPDLVCFLQYITFVNLQHENTNSKSDFVLKNRFETFVLKISIIQKNLTQFDEFNE